MKIKDLAELLDMSEREVIAMLKSKDVVELNLKDKQIKEDKDLGKLEVL